MACAYGRKQHATADTFSKRYPGLSKRALGKLAEEGVANYFRERGYIVEPQKPNAPFDLLLRDGTGAKCRVEVRCARVFKTGYAWTVPKDPRKHDLFGIVKPDHSAMIFLPSKLFWENPTNSIVLRLLSKEA